MDVRAHTRHRFGDMAYKRQDFIDHVQQHVGGALKEFYKARLATKNGHTKWVRHWNMEVRTLLHSLVVVVLHPVRGFTDRGKAVAQALAELKAQDARYRRYAENVLPDNYKLAVKKHLDDADTRAFWHLVDQTVAPAIKAG